ncbi:protein Jumonji isoform X1 [Alosa sapidissima]|uniref:protein Jumonji isoform X1 n=1 Tax=Alosa sapidissima TaxID=34773 RepID=UPI001C096657|nr:protein Jumonji isoform X1 [Alosa sapidissima]
MSRERPKRNIIQKKFDDNDGIPWSEERVVRRVLYLSLKEFKREQKSKVLGKEGHGKGGINGVLANGHLSGSSSRSTASKGFTGSSKADRSRRLAPSHDGVSESSEEGPVRKRPRLQAQRKFAQSQPNSPTSTPVKMVETMPPSPVPPLSELSKRRPKTEDFLTFLCLRGSSALPSSMVYFGTAQEDADVEEDDEEGDQETEAAGSEASTSCQSTPRKHKSPGKPTANGHGIFSGQAKAAGVKEVSLRSRGKETPQARDRSQREQRSDHGAPARASTTHNLRPSRAVQERPLQVSRMNGALRESSTSTRKAKHPLPPPPPPPPPTKAVKYPKGHVTYTKARLLKEAKLNPGARTSQSATSRTNSHSHASNTSQPPHKINSGKARQSSQVKTVRAALPPKADGCSRLNGRSSGRGEAAGETRQVPRQPPPPRRNGLRQSKRQLEAAGGGTSPARNSPEVGIKKVKVQVVSPETSCKKADAVPAEPHVPEKVAAETAAETASAVPSNGDAAAAGSQQTAASQRPKRVSAGRLMFTRQAQPRPPPPPLPPFQPPQPKTAPTPPALPPPAEPPKPAEPKAARERERGKRGAGTGTRTGADTGAGTRTGADAGAGTGTGTGADAGPGQGPFEGVTDVPVFEPSAQEFQDPLAFVARVRERAEPFGLCRMVPPPCWRPECKLKDEMRFVTQVQHVHKLGRRWGPNVQRLACIRKHLRTQAISLDEPPLIGGCELDLARFFQLINDMGGMQQVSDLKKWSRLADLLGIPKSAQDRLAKLQEAYCQYLLSYDSLPAAERARLECEVLADKEQLERHKGPLEGQADHSQQALLLLPRSEPKNGLLNGVLHPNGAHHHQGRLRELQLDTGGKASGASGTSNGSSSRRRTASQEKRAGGGGEEEETEQQGGVLSDQHKCVYRGKSMSLTTFFRTARNTMNMCFSKEPDAAEVEEEYWRIVEERESHVAVHCGRIDTKTHGSGFPMGKSEPFSKHGWNLTVLPNNSGSILRHLGAVSGVTIPWLNIGMVFSTSCWSRDQNRLPYIDYLHTGADCIWYCIPAEEKTKLDKVVHTLLQANGTPGLEMLEKGIMISPEVLCREGIRVHRTVQKSGQFMICFPGTFVAKVCCGYSVSETVHFATAQWMTMGHEAAKELKRRRMEEPFSTERLLYKMGMFESRRENKLLQSTISSLLRDLRDTEISQRQDLFKAGLRSSARYRTLDSSQPPTEGRKKPSARLAEDTSDRRCQTCQHLCYLSMVVQESDNVVFCLECTLHLVQKRRSSRGLKMMYRYDEEQMNSLLSRVSGRVQERSSERRRAEPQAQAPAPCPTPAQRSPRAARRSTQTPKHTASPQM